MRFWDTSGIIPLCVEEPMSSITRHLAETDNAVAVWWGTPVECASAIARLEREGAESARVAEAFARLDALARA